MPTTIIGPEFPVPAVQVEQTEEAIQNPPKRGVVPTVAEMGAAPELATAYVELTTTFFQVGENPIFTTLFTLPMVTTQAASFVWWCFTATWLHTGPFPGNVAVNFVFRLNGVLLQGGVTDNRDRSRIGPVARNGRRAVTLATNPQVLEVEVTHFAGPFNTVQITPLALPNLQHAALLMEEQL